MLNIRARTRVVAVACVALVALLVTGSVLGSVILGVLTLALIYSLGAVSIDLLAAYSGQFSVGQFGYYAVSAYMMVYAVAHWHVGVLLGVLIGIAASALVGWFMALGAVRLPEFGTALVSFFFAAVIAGLVESQLLAGITGGESGVPVPNLRVGSFSVESPSHLYYLSWVSLAVVIVIAQRYVRSRSGHALLAIKRSPVVAASLGVAVYREKIKVQMVGAAMAGLGGCLFAASVGYLSPGSFDVTLSTMLLVMAAVGGLGSLVGPVLGAVAYTMVNYELSQSATQVAPVVMAVAFLLVVIGFEAGIFGIGEEILAAGANRLATHRTAVGASTGRAATIAAWSPGTRLLGTRLLGGRVESRTPTGSSRGQSPEAPLPPIRGEEVLMGRDLTVSFGCVRALKGATLRVLSGEILAVVGPNGAGKTTLLDVLSGVRVPDAGQVTLKGTDVSSAGVSQRHVSGLSRTFQHTAAIPELTAIENVELGAYGSKKHWLVTELAYLGPARVEKWAAQEAASEALALVQFDPGRLGRRAGLLTMGEQKRVDIARSLAGRPKVLLLDEPTAGLAIEDMEEVGQALKAARDTGVGVLMVCHHLEFVKQVADRVVVMNFGEVVAEGAAIEVLEQEPVERVLVGLQAGEVAR